MGSLFSPLPRQCNLSLNRKTSSIRNKRSLIILLTHSVNTLHPLGITTVRFFFVASANTDIEQLQDELLKKTDANLKQQDEIICLSYEMRDIHRRLNELKKENDELKVLLSITGKHRHEYETKVRRRTSSSFAFLSYLDWRSREELHWLSVETAEISARNQFPAENGPSELSFVAHVGYPGHSSNSLSLSHWIC